MSSDHELTRRTMLRSAGTAGAAATVLTVAACGGSPERAATTGGAAPGERSAANAVAGTALASVADVPVGGGVVLTEPKLVVTQPTAGQFRAYSSICPHQGCPVTQVQDGFIVCPCHGSRFAVATGQPTPDSPAKSALVVEAVSVVGGTVVRA